MHNREERERNNPSVEFVLLLAVIAGVLVALSYFHWGMIR